MSTPAPLIGSDVDLRDFPYMPLDVVRLRDSETAILVSGDGFRAAVLLWCAAWHQIPAASLPDEDRTLAHLSGFGRDLQAWAQVKSEALRGFVKCSDGRLYHPTIAQKADEAWQSRIAFRKRTEAARRARAEKRTENVGGDTTTSVTENVTEIVSSSVTSTKGREGKGRDIIDIPIIVNNPLDGRNASPQLPEEPTALRKPKRAKVKTQIDEDAQPSERDRAAADEAGLTAEMFRTEWRKFRDHHRAEGSLKLDWAAAWRYWLGNVQKYQPRAAARAGPHSSPEKRSNVAQAIEELHGEFFGQDWRPSPGSGTGNLIEFNELDYSRSDRKTV